MVRLYTAHISHTFSPRLFPRQVTTLKEGVHSGGAGGIVPSSFRILRNLLDRLEDSNTGRLLVDDLHVEIPSQRVEQAQVGTASSSPLGISFHQKSDGCVCVCVCVWACVKASGSVPGQQGPL
jgi:hypothetical protein